MRDRLPAGHALSAEVLGQDARDVSLRERRDRQRGVRSQGHRDQRTVDDVEARVSRDVTIAVRRLVQRATSERVVRARRAEVAIEEFGSPPGLTDRAASARYPSVTIGSRTEIDREALRDRVTVRGHVDHSDSSR